MVFFLFNNSFLFIIPGNNKLCNYDHVMTLMENALLLNERPESTLSRKVKRKVCVENAAGCYQMLSIFNQSKLSKFTLHYIERTFTDVCETESFLELNVLHILKITASSELLVNSELEVYYAACAWIDFDYKERCNFSEILLLKVRMHLLSENVYTKIKNNSQNSPLFSSLGKTEESLSAITEALHSRDNFYHKKGRSLNTNRYNSQTMFNYMFFGKYESEDGTISCSLNQIDCKDFKNVKKITKTPERFYRLTNLAFINGVIYAF